MLSSLQTELAALSDPSQPPQNRFSDIYQQSRTVESQDDRRRRLLKEYRNSKRDDTLLKKYAATFADVCDNNESTLDVSLIENEVYGKPLDDVETSPRSSTKFSPHHKSKIKYPRLMLSEWMLEVPSDFEDSWIMIPCPVGKRCSLVTCRGETFAYSRTGLHLLTGLSDLPGGSSTKRQTTSFTVLDCVFDQSRRIFHLLDVLYWNGTSLIENTVEFRRFWLQSRLAEIERHSLEVDDDKYELVMTQQYACGTDELERAFAATKSVSALDGYLFYHKEGLYVSSTTPLVCWLKPYMITEILRLPVSEAFMKATPHGYIDLVSHVKSMEDKRPIKYQRNRRQSLSQDAEEMEVMPEVM